jgi:hypothetical protein
MHIALITFIIMTILFAVFTFLFYRQASHNGQRADTAETNLDAARQATNDSLNSVNYIKAMLGAGESTFDQLEATGFAGTEENGLLALKSQFDLDMQEFGEGLPEGDRNYPSICKNLIVKIKNANIQQIASANEAQRILKEKDDEIAKQLVITGSAEQARQTAADDLVGERTKFEGDRKNLTNQIGVKDGSIRTLQGELATTQQTAAEREDELKQDLEGVETVLKTVSKKLTDITRPNFEVPDGRIVSVSQRTGRAWINLGSADGLRRQVTFSVYPAGTIGVGDDVEQKSKGGIIVTEVLDEHLAEVRMIDPILNDPILSDDIFYSPIFQPGRKIHVALSGLIDLNNDGRSDHNLVKNLIEVSGGVVDAELLDDGTLIGSINNSTRFLVIGDEPNGKDTDYVVKFSELDSDADRNGAVKIKVDDLLNFMGWKAEVRIVSLGKGASESGDSAGVLNTPARGDDGGAY